MHNSYQGPAVMGVRDQARVVNQILGERFEKLLPALMRETGFDMWITICHEDNHDPIFNTLIPWECWAPILQMVVFYDAGTEKGVERLNISLTNMQGLMMTIWGLDRADDQWAILRHVVEERNPRRIGINTSDVIWAADGLTASLKDKLVATLGENLSNRLESAEPLAIRWLESRLPAELELYMRGPENRARWGENDKIIRPGDMIHCDVGFKYLRLITDHQELAYVLRPGETTVPQGLLNGMAQANKLQDIFTDTWELGLTGNEILSRALTRARESGISKPKIYSHSLSHYLHEPGPLMGLPWEQVNTGGRGEVKMNYDTCYTVELGVTCPVPEWGGQEVAFPLEQDAVFTEKGAVYLDGRQTQFHII
jgi:hypothetical protein